MSRRVCSIFSSRLARASAIVSFSAASAVRRARATISSAWPRASDSRSRYSRSSSSASRLTFSAESIESSIIFWRLSSASAILGKATFHRMMRVRPKMISVQIITPTTGLTSWLPLPSSAASRKFIALLEKEGDQARHEAVEEAGLGEGEAEPLDRRDLVAHLRLAGDRLDHLSEDDADAHAGTNCAEAATDAECDGPASLLTVLRGGEDEAQDHAQGGHWGDLLLVGFGDRAAEIDRGQGGEDERLEGRHETDLEQVEDQAEREQEDADAGESEQDRKAAGHEQDDQVPGEHVGEQTHGERDDPHHVRQQLEDEDEARHGAGDARGDEALEVAADALDADALGRVREEHDQREHQRDRDVRGRRIDGEGRDLQAEQRELLVRRRQRDEPDQVREPDEQEERPEEGEPLRRHLLVHVPAG